MKIQPFILCASKETAPNAKLLKAFELALQGVVTNLRQDVDLALLVAPEFFLAQYNEKDHRNEPTRDGFPATVEKLCALFTGKCEKLVIIPGTALLPAPANTVFNRATVWYQGQSIGFAYKKFAPKNEIKTLPRLLNGAEWPTSAVPLIGGGDVESLRKMACRHPQSFVDDLDIFSINGVNVGIEICNDIGFMKAILQGAAADLERWPDVLVMPSGGMTLGNAYLSTVGEYVDIRGGALKGWFGSGPSVKCGGDNMLDQMAVRPKGLLIQCDGPASICGVLDPAGSSFSMYKPQKVQAFTEMKKSAAYAQQPVALQIFDAISLS